MNAWTMIIFQPIFFVVEFDSIQTARFLECSGVKMEFAVYEIEEGSLNTTTYTIIDRFYSKNENLLYTYFRETLFRYAGTFTKVNWPGAFPEIDERIKEHVDSRILNTKTGPHTNNIETINGYILR